MFKKKKVNQRPPAEIPVVNNTVDMTPKRREQESISIALDDGTTMSMLIGNAQNQGSRSYQEDSFGYSNISDAQSGNKGFAAVLADGMGGLANGKAISDYTVCNYIAMLDSLDYQQPLSKQFLQNIKQINNQVCAEYSKGKKSSAGSTLVAAFFYKKKLYWQSVGDSRIYLIRRGLMYQLNEDHDYYNNLLADYMYGKAEADEIKKDPQKDSLTSFIGNSSLPLIDISKDGFEIESGDTFLLCSDGIYNCIEPCDIIGAVTEFYPQEASEEIAKTVLNNRVPGQDNLTIMIISF